MYCVCTYVRVYIPVYVRVGVYVTIIVCRYLLSLA